MIPVQVVAFAVRSWWLVPAYFNESLTFVRRVLRLVLAFLAFFGHGR